MLQSPSLDIRVVSYLTEVWQGKGDVPNGLAWVIQRTVYHFLEGINWLLEEKDAVDEQGPNVQFNPVNER